MSLAKPDEIVSVGQADRAERPERETRKALTHEPHSAVRDSATVGVVTIDDQAVFRSAAHDVIEATPGFLALGEAASGAHGLVLVDELNPELVLVDVRMPGMNGVETARRLTESHPRSVVVLVSIADSANVPSAARESGAVAFVCKQDFGRAMLVDLWETYGRR